MRSNSSPPEQYLRNFNFELLCDEVVAPFILVEFKQFHNVWVVKVLE
jgi:hypothetical protein